MRKDFFIKSCKCILRKASIILLFFQVIIYGQGSQTDYRDITRNYSLSSPDVNSFERYSLTNTDYYTGKLDVSIPIYTIKTGGIEYPIKLVYNTGGIKVDQLSSEVGLGWNITSSIITRTINHNNDFDNSGRLQLQSDVSTYSSDDISNDQLKFSLKCGYFLQKEITDAGGYPPKIGAWADVDFIPDLYHFFGSGSKVDFFFNDVNTPLELNPSGAKIEAIVDKRKIDTRRRRYDNGVWQPVYNLTTKDFFTIIITTNEGIKYTFSDCDYSFLQAFNSNAKIESPAQISAWHISKIDDLKTGKKIDFIYDNTSSNPYYPINSNSSSPFDVLMAQRIYSYSSNLNYDPQNPLTYIYTESETNTTARIDVQIKRLKKIIFEEGEIEFNYNNQGIIGQSVFTRDDVYNSDCLTQIFLKDKNSTTIKSFDFTYSYFTSNYNVGEFNPDLTNNPTRYKRLKLTSFGEIGKPKYKFTYDENNKLPPINSYSIDFLGYFNNSIDNNSANNSSNRTPTLYYYQNQFEKSLLPFPVSSMNPAFISGYYNRQANSFSKTWSLTKLDFPTGGSTEYTYESSDFEIFGQNVLGGGIRIAQQKLNDDRGGQRIINYYYKKENGLSSGGLASIPFFGFPINGNFNYELTYPQNEQGNPNLTFYSDNTNINWQLYDKNNLNADLTSGSYVGYSRVIEKELGNGRTEFKFTSNDMQGFENEIFRISPKYLNSQLQQPYFEDLLYQFDQFGQILLDQAGNPEFRIDSSPDWAIGNSALFSNFFTDNSYKRGKLLEKKIFKENNDLLEKTTISYNENLINSFGFRQGLTHIKTYPIYVSPYSVNYYETFLRLNMEAFIIVKKNIKISQYLPQNKTVSKFYNGNQIDEVINYSFNDLGFPTTIANTAANGDFDIKKYYYPRDVSMFNEPFVNDLRNRNIIGSPLKTETYRNTEKLSEMKTIYGNDSSTSNLLLPKYVFAKKGDDTNSSLERKITYDSYDDKGNLTQYTQENGVPVAMIWGYNKTKLIAKIENIAYSAIPQGLITTAQNASNIANNETNVLTALNAIRTSSTVANSMITTYTHIPLVGVSTITDPKGDKVTYTYDTFGRVQNIRDKDNNIVTENDYNYKP